MHVPMLRLNPVPLAVLTPLIQAQIEAKAAAAGVSIEQAQQQLLLEKQPSGAFVRQTDIGQLALFLCSPAADQITGASLPVDGGWLSQ